MNIQELKNKLQKLRVNEDEYVIRWKAKLSITMHKKR